MNKTTKSSGLSVLPRKMHKQASIIRILLFLCLILLAESSYCYAERIKSYLRSDGATVSWYKRCDSNGNVRENYSYEIGQQR